MDFCWCSDECDVSFLGELWEVQKLELLRTLESLAISLFPFSPLMCLKTSTFLSDMQQSFVHMIVEVFIGGSEVRVNFGPLPGSS